MTRAATSPRLAKAARIAYLAIAGVASAMAVSSYFASTSAGFDFEEAVGSGVDATYYRLRWDDGSTWIGRVRQPVAVPDRPLDWFDPGGRVFQRRNRLEHRTRANALGFWWIGRPDDDPYDAIRYANARSDRWAAVPSWLVLLALWGVPLARWAGRLRRRGRGGPPDGTTRLAESGEGR